MPVSSVNQSQVQEVVTTTVTEVEVAAPSVGVETPSVKPKAGDNWGGVEKGGNSTAKGGQWDAADHTGNSSADSVLSRFAAANAGNPAALAAVEGAAGAIRQAPEKFINGDGSINQGAFTELLSAQFGQVDKITIPVPGARESAGNLGGVSESHGNLGGSGAATQVNNGSVVYENLGNISNMDIGAIAFLVMMEASKSAREDLKAIMDGVKAINKEKEGWRACMDTVNKLSAGSASLNAGDTVTNWPGQADGAFASGSPSVGTYDHLAPGDGNDTGHALSDKNSIMMQTPNGPMQFVGSRDDGGFSKQDADNMKETVKNKLDSLSEMGEMESLRLQMAMDRMSKMMSTLSNLLKKMSETQSGITQNLK